MKTEMKKNNKMFLALAVIAALAMVSVAGVALNSEESEALIIAGDNVTVEVGETYTGDFNITDEGTLNVYGTYSGTVKFYKAGEVKADDLVTVIVFTGLTNAVIENIDGEVTISTYNSKTLFEAQNVTGGTINVTQGKLTLGKTDVKYFAGTVSGKTMTLTSVNTYGAVIEAGSTDALSGHVMKGAQYKVGAKDVITDMLPAKLTVSGTGVYKGTTTVGANVELVIAEGATLSNYVVSAQTYALDVAITGTAASGKLLNTTAPYAKAYDGVVLTADHVTFANVDVSKEYYVAIVYTDPATAPYFAKVTFTVTGDTVSVAMVNATKVTVIDNATATGGLNKGVTAAGTTDTVLYNNTDTMVYAKAGAVDGVITSGTVTFASLADGVAAPMNLLFFKADGTAMYYKGTLTPNIVTGSNALIASTDIVAPTGSVAPGVPTSTLTLNANSTLTVEGTLKAVKASDAVFGVINNSAGGKIDVTGLIQYDHATGLDTDNLTATAYKVTTTEPAKTTYYYTTFNKALAASADITVYGEKAFLENQTWETGVADAEETKITFATGATATVGSFYEKDVSEDVFVTITVPETTTVTITGAKALEVVNGKIIFLESELADTPSAGIKSAVGMIEGTSYVYTDLSTALSTAVAEDIITLRDEAKIAGNAEIKAGVEVVGGAYKLTVYAGASFTVSGKITSTGETLVEGAVGEKVAGKLIINSEDFKMTGVMTLNGVLEITDKVGAEESWDLPCSITVGDAGAITSDAFAIINIAGDVSTVSGITIAKTGTVTADANITINVTGKFAITEESIGFTDVITTINVTGEFSFEDNELIKNLNVTGKGIVKKADAGVLTVSGKAVIGTPAKELAAVANGATAKFTLGATGNAIVYGTPAAGKVDITATPNATTLFMDTTILYATVYTGAVVPTNVAVDTPEITGKKFMGYYDNPAFIVTGDIYVNEVPVTAAGAKYYMKLDIATTDITVDTPVGAVVKINGATYDGNESVPYASSYTITVSALKGYNADNAKILVNGEPVTGTVELKAGDVITVEGIEEASEQGSNIVVYLLIAITVIIAVIAVVVAVKLLRS